MVSKRNLSTKDPTYRKIIKMGPAIAPDLKRIAENKEIQWHYIAYWMLGQIKDRTSIPFLMEAMESEEEWVQIHANWGLDCLLRLGRYNRGDPDAEKIRAKYRRWWEKHKDDYLTASKRR